MSSPTSRPTGLAHVSLAVRDAEATAARYAELFGAVVRSRERLSDRGLLVLFLDVAGVPLELVQPLDPKDESNTVVRFLNRQGEGLHHVAFSVPDCGAALAHAQSVGAEPVDRAPRLGAHGTRVAFLHPRSTSGALIEFVEGESTASREP